MDHGDHLSAKTATWFAWGGGRVVAAVAAGLHGRPEETGVVHHHFATARGVDKGQITESAPKNVRRAASPDETGRAKIDVFT